MQNGSTSTRVRIARWGVAADSRTASAASMVASIMRRRLSSISMAIECIEAFVMPSKPPPCDWAGGATTGRICRRHVGQRPSLFSHSVTHALWKVWLQMRVVDGESSSSPRQMTHSPCSTTSAASPSAAGAMGFVTIAIVMSEGPASDDPAAFEGAVVDSSACCCCCCCAAGSGGDPGTATTAATTSDGAGETEPEALPEGCVVDDMLCCCCWRCGFPPKMLVTTSIKRGACRSPSSWHQRPARRRTTCKFLRTAVTEQVLVTKCEISFHNVTE